MGIFSRFTDIVNANINAMLDKAEDPEKIVRLMIQEMEDTLVEVRSSAARAIADRKQLDRRLEAVKAELAEWDHKAELAVRKDRDDLARAALAERSKVSERVEIIKHQHGQVDEALANLKDDIVRLEEKLTDAKTRQKALVMRHQTASDRLEVRKHTHETKIDDALVRFEQFERKMENMEGRVEAYDLTPTRDLRREFSSLENNESVEQALADLKQRIRTGDDSGQQA
ncbi:MAG: phage shock protein PspA [Gammaproteobacteria bacterium]|jgi:phage shock protein A